MYIDSASVNDIKEGLSLGCVEGVTTNPTLLAKEGRSRQASLKEIFTLKPAIVFVQIIGETKEEMLADLDSLLSEVHFIDPDKNVKLGVKIPVCVEGLKALKVIRQDYPELVTLGTAIYSASQGILGVDVGFDYLAPYVNRMEKEGIDPFEAISQIKDYVLDKEYETKILAASFKEVEQVMKAYDSGADTCTLSLDLLEAMLEVPVALKAIKVFNEDGLKIK